MEIIRKIKDKLSRKRTVSVVLDMKEAASDDVLEGDEAGHISIKERLTGAAKSVVGYIGIRRRF